MIPIFDLSKADDDNHCKELVAILSTIGFVYLKNHGVSTEEIDTCKEVFSDFFSKDVEYKESFIENQENPFLGYKGCETEKLDPNRQVKDAREAMLFWAHDVRANRWPNDAIRNVVVSLVNQIGVLAKRVLKMLGVGLELQDQDLFVKSHSAFTNRRGKSYVTFRVNHYPKLEQGELKGDQVLCGEHADYGSVTFLIQDHVGGLEVTFAFFSLRLRNY